MKYENFGVKRKSKTRLTKGAFGRDPLQIYRRNLRQSKREQRTEVQKNEQDQRDS